MVGTIGDAVVVDEWVVGNQRLITPNSRAPV